MGKRTALRGSVGGQGQQSIAGLKIKKKQVIDDQAQADAAVKDAAQANELAASKGGAPALGDTQAFAAMLADAASSGTGSTDQGGGGTAAKTSGGGVSTGLLVAGGLAILGGAAAAAGGGKSAPATPPAPVNQPPAFAGADTAVSVDEDKVLNGSVKATDANGDAITYAVGTRPTNGTVTVNADGTYVYTPNADGKGGTATQTINFTVKAVVPEDGSIDVGTALTAVAIDASKDLGGNSPADWALSDNSSKETNVEISNFSKGDTINVSGKSTDYSFTTVGSDLVITYNNTTASVVNKIVLAGVAPTGFVSDEASAEAVLGYNFFNAATSSTGSGTSDAAGLAAGKLDSDDDGNVVTTAIVDASKAAIAFTENANVANTVRITGFTKDDTITLSNAQVSNYSFQGIGTDVVMTYNNSGVVNSITLAGINANGGVISSYNDVKTLVGADFFKVASTPAPTNSQSIDNGTANSPVSYNASASGINFTDNAASETNVKITGFGADDRITVTGATSSQYSFTTINTDGNGTADLVITFNNTAASVVNSITLLEAVSANAFVADFATAQAAMNNSNFMVFG